MNRAVLFDTETTGLDAARGDRIVEIAALEMINEVWSGRKYHVLIDPERDIPPEATRIHGYTIGDLKGKPKFGDIVEDLLAFFGDDPLIAHNASFDFAFVNEELRRCGYPLLDSGRAVDTLHLARKKFPGMPASLDALCRRFGVDLSERTRHSALLDCRLLAEVYTELNGGRQKGLDFMAEGEMTEEGHGMARIQLDARPRGKMAQPSPGEKAAHEEFIRTRIPNSSWVF